MKPRLVTIVFAIGLGLLAQLVGTARAEPAAALEVTSGPGLTNHAGVIQLRAAESGERLTIDTVARTITGADFVLQDCSIAKDSFAGAGWKDDRSFAVSGQERKGVFSVQFISGVGLARHERVVLMKEVAGEPDTGDCANAAPEIVAWGEAVNGLRAGLAPLGGGPGGKDCTEAIRLELHLKNVGERALVLSDVNTMLEGWTVEFTPVGGGQTIVGMTEHLTMATYRSDIKLAKAEEATRLVAEPKLSLVGMKKLPPGTCRVKMVCDKPPQSSGVTPAAANDSTESSGSDGCWHGQVATGTVEIEVKASTVDGSLSGRKP